MHILKALLIKNVQKESRKRLDQEGWDDELVEIDKTTETSGDDKKWSMWD